MKKLLAIVLLLTFVLPFAACEKDASEPEAISSEVVASETQRSTEASIEEPEAPTTEAGIPEDFSFSLVYGVCGDLTYDSESGELVKQRVATRVEDYTTTFFFTDEQKQRVYDLIVAMNPASYPDEYSPLKGSTIPSLMIILTATYNGVTKTITCHSVPIGGEAVNEQGEAFMEVLHAITKAIYASDKWQALPDYEFYYE